MNPTIRQCAVLLVSLLACGAEPIPMTVDVVPSAVGMESAAMGDEEASVSDEAVEACLQRRPKSSAPTDRACPIAHFYKINDEHYRGARPDSSGLALLSRLGVRTIISMEDYTSTTPRVRERERQAAEALGIAIHFLPVSPLLPLRRDYVDGILELIGLQTNQPVYLHCLFGTERTGFIMGLDRVFNQGWCPQDAYREMLDYGFRGYLVPALRRDFFAWTKGRCDGAQPPDVDEGG